MTRHSARKAVTQKGDAGLAGIPPRTDLGTQNIDELCIGRFEKDLRSIPKAWLPRFISLLYYLYLCMLVKSGTTGSRAWNTRFSARFGQPSAC